MRSRNYPLTANDSEAIASGNYGSATLLPTATNDRGYCYAAEYCDDVGNEHPADGRNVDTYHSRRGPGWGF